MNPPRLAPGDVTASTGDGDGIRARAASVRFGERVLWSGVDLDIGPGTFTAILGPNGAGKSTVLKMMAGLEQPSNGDALLSPGYSVGILLQEPPLNEAKDVLLGK